MVEVHRLHVAQHDARKGLVQLPQVDVMAAHARPVKQLARHELRPRQHDQRFRADRCHRLDPGAGFQPIFLAHLLVADQHRRRAIDNAAAVARMMDMVHPLQLRIFEQRDRVEARHLLAQRRKARL